MFYSPELLTTRDSGFGLLWLAATLGSKSTLKKLTKKSVLTADISHLCNMIAQPSEPLALRLSSNLMIGVARVYKLKHEIFVNDVTTVYSSLKKVGDLGFQHVVDPASLQMKKSTTTGDKITLARSEDMFFDLGLDEIAWDWDITNDTMNIVQPLSRSKSPAGNRSLHTIDESHLQSLSVDMEGGDYLELENIFGNGSVPIDLELDDLGWGLPQTAPSEGDTTFDKPNELTNVLEDYPMDDFVNMEPPVQESLQSPVDAASKQTPDRAPFRASNNEGKSSREPQASRPILASLMDPVNIPLSPDAIEQVEFYPLENTSLESSNLDDNGGGIVQAASIAVKSKRSKKQVRVLLDARTELTDKELRETRDNYLQEQSRLRHEMEQQRLQKTVIERANELLYGPPDILEAEPLRQLWSNALVALIETKTGLITLVKPPRKKRPAKRRRLNGSDEHVRQVVREGIEENEGTGMDVDEVGYQAEFFGGDINTEVNTGGPEFDIRLSEEPEMLRAAPSRAGSINSIEFPRAQDNIEFETLHSGLFPWDNAAPSSPTPRSLAASIGNGTGRKSLDFDVIDTNVELRSLSGSRRTSVTSSQRPGSPAVPASIGEVHIDEFRFSVGEGEDVIMETQRLEAPWGKLERNLNNFFAHLKMQQNLKGDTEMTLDDIIGQEKTVRVVANAFHCVLALTTKSLVRVTQAEAFGTIFLKVVQ